MKTKPDPETDNAPLYGTRQRDLEKNDESLQFPGDLQPKRKLEDMETVDQKPDMEEIEEV